MYYSTTVLYHVFPSQVYVFVLGDSFFVRHVIDNHVGTSSLYQTLSRIIMFEVDKKEERERERGDLPSRAHIPFETSFEDVVTKNEDRCFELVSEAVKAGYSAETITVEVGSRGLPNTNGLNRLKHLLQIHQKVLEDSLIELDFVH